jgi:hypothetical protein
MGGPIKEGIMHGIREPYRGGGAALVGNPVYPRTGGREHHNLWLKAGQGVGRTLPHIRRAGQTFKDWASRTFGSTGPVTGQTTTKSLGPWTKGPFQGTEKIIGDTKQVWTPKEWVARDPVYKVLRKGYENKGFLGKPLRWAYDTARTPTGMVGIGYGATQYLKGDEKPDPGDAPISVPLNPNLQELQKKTKADATANAAAFAKEQRNNRVEKYLKMMGYDSAKKTAIADALIDASKIVSDRGTLDRKNITAELINPAIQAFSKRLDKPQQIREAVGLMATKAEIEKDLEDPTVKALRMKQLEKLDKELSPGVGPSIMAYMATKKDDIKGTELVDLVRLAANQEGTPFKFISEEEIAKIPGMEGKTALEIVSQTAETDGVYMVGDAVIEIKGGIPKQIK